MNFSTCTLMYRALMVCCLVFFFQQAKAQEIHFSQFRNAPLQLSPALAGIFDGDARFMANYRSQWHDVPVNYRTVNGVFDTRFGKNKSNTNFFGGGLVFNYDWAGDSKLSTAYLGLNGSYTHRLTQRNFLSGGISIGGFQRSFKTDDLRWDDQFNGKFVDPNAPSGENFTDKSIFYGDFSVGLNWHFRQDEKIPGSRTNFDIGAGLLHLNEPKKNFYDEEDVRLPKLFNIYGLATLQLRPKWDLVLLATGKYQGPEREHLIGAAGRYHLNPKPTQKTALQLGVSYRWNAEGLGTGDAIIPNAELHYKDWLFGLSYDINVSDFGKDPTNATNGRGGPEFSLIYIIKHVDEKEFCPTCPVYE